MLISLSRCSVRLSTFNFQRSLSVQPDIGSDGIQVESIESAGVITINKPKVMNSINETMIKKIYRSIVDIEKDKKLLIIKGVPNCFSAGGDLRALLRDSPLNELLKVPIINVIPFKYPEYYVLDFLNTYKIPYISLMDGMIMGAGLGIAINGRYRVATERTLLVMPENKFGYFVDVGASYFFPRLPRNLGIYLGITGAGLKGTSVLKAGLATQYVNSQKLPELEASLVKCTNDSEIQAVLDRYAERVEDGPVTDNMENIEKCFIPDTVENIIERLETVQNDWSKKVLKTMQSLSPGSMKLTLRCFQLGAKLSYNECLRMELQVVVNTCKYNYDIVKGIRAIIFDKSKKANWSPATLEEVKEDYIERFFQPSLPELQFRS